MKHDLYESRLEFLVRQYQRLEPEQQDSIDYLIDRMLALRPTPQNVILLERRK